MAVNASGFQATREKAPAQEDSDSNFSITH